MGYSLACLLAVGCGSNSSSSGTPGKVCSAVAPCGGALEGTWQLDTTCDEGNLAAAMASQQNLPAACNNLFQSASPTLTGTVQFAGGMETDTLTTTLNATVLYTSACVSALSGTTVALNATICSILGPSLTGSGGFTTATCTFASGGCSCAVSMTSQSDTTAQPYTLSGNTIVYTSGSDPMDYCVSGTTLTTRGAVAGLSGVTFVTTAHKL